MKSPDHPTNTPALAGGAMAAAGVSPSPDAAAPPAAVSFTTEAARESAQIAADLIWAGNFAAARAQLRLALEQLSQIDNPEIEA